MEFLVGLFILMLQYMLLEAIDQMTFYGNGVYVPIAFGAFYFLSFLISWILRLIFHVIMNAENITNMTRKRNIERFEKVTSYVLMFALAIILTIIFFITSGFDVISNELQNLLFALARCGAILFSAQVVYMYKKSSVLRVIIVFCCILLFITLVCVLRW